MQNDQTKKAWGHKVGVVFTVKKGNRQARWKIIPHPYFDNAFALVRDHPYLCTHIGEDNIFCQLRDLEHIVGGGATIEQAWQSAYEHT